MWTPDNNFRSQFTLSSSVSRIKLGLSGFPAGTFTCFTISPTWLFFKIVFLRVFTKNLKVRNSWHLWYNTLDYHHHHQQQKKRSRRKEEMCNGLTEVSSKAQVFEHLISRWLCLWRDRETLGSWGHARRCHWSWALRVLSPAQLPLGFLYMLEDLSTQHSVLAASAIKSPCCASLP